MSIAKRELTFSKSEYDDDANFIIVFLILKADLTARALSSSCKFNKSSGFFTELFN